MALQRNKTIQNYWYLTVGGWLKATWSSALDGQKDVTETLQQLRCSSFSPEDVDWEKEMRCIVTCYRRRDRDVGNCNIREQGISWNADIPDHVEPSNNRSDLSPIEVLALVSAVRFAALRCFSSRLAGPSLVIMCASYYRDVATLCRLHSPWIIKHNCVCKSHASVQPYIRRDTCTLL